MEINEKLLENVAKVARLKLSETELKEFTPQLAEVIESFKVLGKIETEDVKPSFQPIDFEEHWEDDNPKKCLSQEDALINSPHQKDGFFKGPKIL